MRFTFVFVLSIFLMLSACSRPQEDSGKISLQIPTQNKVGALNVSQLARVIVNVSGQGINPTIVRAWDMKEQCPTCDESQYQPLGDTFELVVPPGDNRMIQILAVYKNDTSNSMDFFYGDAVTKIAAGDNSVPITITQIGAGGTEDGRISGRYLTGVNSGPSGPIEIRYKPADKPTMIVDRDMMVNGWFEVFGLKDVSFTYFMPIQNLDLFGNVNLESAIFTPTNKVIKVKLPEFSRSNSENESAKTHVYGFFGGTLVTAGKSVCYQESYTFTNIFVKNTSTPLTYDTSGSPNANVISILKGGGTTSCASLDLTNDMIPVRAKQLDGNGNDSIAHFKGVFARFLDSSSNYSLNSLTQSGGQTHIQFYVLPTIDNTKISGIRAYVADFKMYSDGIVMCEAFENGHLGFRRVAEKTFDFSTQGPHTISIPTPTTTNWSIALCPFKDGRVFNAGQIVRNENYGGGGGGGGTTLATDYDISGPNKISMGQCHKFSITLKNGSNYNVTTDSAKNFDLSSTGVTSTFYPNPDCSSGSVSSISIPSGQTRMVFSMLTSGGGNGSVNSNTNSFNIAHSTNFQYTTSPGTALDVQFAQPYMHLGNVTDCRPVDVFVVDSSGFPTSHTISLAVTTSDASFDVYSDASCTTSTATLSISGTYRGTLYVKSVAAVPGNSWVNLVFSTFDDKLVVNPNPVVDHLSIDIKYNSIPYTNGNVFSQDCYEVRVSSSSNNTAPVPISSTISTANGLLYTDPACVSGSTFVANFSIPQGNNISSNTWYYKPNNAVPYLTFDGYNSPLVQNPAANLQYPALNFFNSPQIIGNIQGWYRSEGANPSVGSWVNFMGVLGSMTSTGSTPGQAALQPFGNNVMQFSGTSQAGLAIPSYSNFSVAMLVKATALSGNTKLLNMFHSDSTYLGVDPSNMIYLSGLNSSVQFQPTNWYVIVFTRQSVSGSSENLNLSVNGGPFNFYNNTGGTVGAAVTQIYFGNAAASFNGEIAEVLVFDKIVSEAEKNILYQYFKNRYIPMALP